MNSSKWIYMLAAVMLFAGFAMPSMAGAFPPISCGASAGVPPAVGGAGYTEPVGDFLLSCTGGVPTAFGDAVPQVNITLFLNTNLTSRELAAIPGGGHFNEALLLIDEPNTLAAGHGILNCGQTGAPDTGPSGPGVCSITATGVPTQTYDASPGHPNAFQGRLGTGSSPSLNVVTFFGVPFDPSGFGSRTLRITNLRANAALIGVSVTPTPNSIQALISITSSSYIPVASPQQTVGYIFSAMTPSVTGAGTATPSITLAEGFSYAFKTKNVSFTVGDNGGTPGNATYSGGFYLYNSHTYYPVDDAQNVPGVAYYDWTGFEWLNNTTNAPPGVNPPLGYDGGAVPNLGDPFASALTGIQGAGRADSGTRVAIQFESIPAGATVNVPELVNLYRLGCATPCMPTGVMVLTNATANGAGPFSRSSATALHSGNSVAVYEVLYADPSTLEYATVNATVSPSGAAGPITESVNLAPFYTTSAAAGQPSATLPTPRFRAATCPIAEDVWKNKPSTWPAITSMVLGSQTYSKAELMQILQSAVSTDASYTMAVQLIAANLNLIEGSDPTPIGSAIATANSLLAGFSGKLPYHVKPFGNAIGSEMTQDASTLGFYNGGHLTPQCAP